MQGTISSTSNFCWKTVLEHLISFQEKDVAFANKVVWVALQGRIKEGCLCNVRYIAPVSSSLIEYNVLRATCNLWLKCLYNETKIFIALPHMKQLLQLQYKLRQVIFFRPNALLMRHFSLNFLFSHLLRQSSHNESSESWL